MPTKDLAGKPRSQRQLRVGEEIRHILARIFERGELHDPDLVGVVLTVTEVRVSPDLKAATAFVIKLGGGDMTGLLAALKRAAPHLRHELAHALRLKFAPVLSFQNDHSFDEASRIDALLRSPVVQADVAKGDAADAPTE